MDIYHIVKKGDPPPGALIGADLGAICETWAQSANKDQAEVIAVSDGTVTRRFTAEDTEAIARFRKH